MELRHLRYFVAVADSLSFTKAAARLHLAQPSLTRQIQNLEEEIGVKLLERSKKHVALTGEGTAFLVDARRMIALAEESIRSVQRLSRGETGQLNVGYLSNFNFELLPKTLVAFREAHPHNALNLCSTWRRRNNFALWRRARSMWALWACGSGRPRRRCSGN
jgi:DNA-binding transcriptional LysR family regulator